MKYLSFSLLLVLFFACSPEEEVSPKVGSKDVDARLNQYWDAYEAHKASNPDSALYYMQEIEMLAKEADRKKWVAAAYGAMGDIQRKQGTLGEATYNYLNAIKTFKELGELRRMAKVYEHLASIYESLEDYKTAVKYSLLAKEILFYKGNANEKANNYRNLAIFYTNLKEFSEAEKYLHLSQEIVLNAQDQSLLGRIYNTTGILHFKQAKYEKAREYYQMAIQHSDSTADGLWVKAAATNNISETYVYEKNYPLAKEWIHKTLARKSEMNDPVFVQSTLNLYAEMLIEQGKYKEAVDLLQNEISLADFTKTNSAYDESIRLSQIALTKIATENNPEDQAYLSQKFALHNIYSKNYAAHAQPLRKKLEILAKQQAVQANVISYTKTEALEEAARKILYIILISSILLLFALGIIFWLIQNKRRTRKLIKGIDDVLNKRPNALVQKIQNRQSKE